MKKRFNKILSTFTILAIISLAFFPYRHGIGNYWDWTVPYFNLSLKSAFLSQLFDWRDISFGQTLAYNSGMYLLWLLNFVYTIKLPTEYIVYLLLVLFGFCTVILSKKLLGTGTKREKLLTWLVAFMIFFNPAIYYKLLAGHISYYLSFLLYTLLLFFLLFRFKPNLRGYLLFALLFAFVGSQVQFFLFAGITIFIYFLLNRKKFVLKYFLIFSSIVFLINLPWLINILLRVNNFSQISSLAQNESFSRAMFTSPIRIFVMVFSSATNIQYAYNKPVFAFFAIFNATLFYLVYVFFKQGLHKKIEGRNSLFLITLWITFCLLSTGFFNKLNIPGLSAFYPMLRESGHLAPLVLLFGSLSLVFVYNSLIVAGVIAGKSIERFNLGLYIYIGTFILINLFTFTVALPNTDFALARKEFLPIKNYIDNEKGAYNIAFYPFWNQYGFRGTEDKVINNKLLNNSGWDSFTYFSGLDYLSNYHSGGSSIDDSLQYKLLANKNSTELAQRNVRYFIDFSSIYKSNYDKYTQSQYYFNDLKNINDPSFTKKFLAINHDLSVPKESIYEIKDYLPRVYSPNAEVLFQKINPTRYRVEIEGVSSDTALYLLENYNRYWRIVPATQGLECANNKNFPNEKATECLVDERTDFTLTEFKKNSEFSSHNATDKNMNLWLINYDKIRTNDALIEAKNSDGSINLRFDLFFWPQLIYQSALVIAFLTLLIITSYLLWSKRKILVTDKSDRV